jgi:hypothetical protein
VIGCFGKLCQRPNVGKITKVGDLEAMTHDPTLIKAHRSSQGRSALGGVSPTRASDLHPASPQRKP